MKYLKITNEGLLDIRLIYLMGGTTKADDKFKIGQFGTGLKYTLAYLLRNNLDFKIFIDGESLKIDTEIEKIRDTNFEIISINGNRTSVTTNMGLEWKAWMILRELWCNAMDEDNPFIDVVDEMTPEKGKTEYYIQCTGAIADVWENWDKFFITKDKVVMDHELFTIYEGGESLRIYKNGILIKALKDQKSVFAYDFKNAEINELREFNGSIAREIAHIIPLYDAKTVELLLEKIKDTFEETLDYEWYSSNFGTGWGEALGDAKVIDYKTYEKIEDKMPSIKDQPIVQVPKSLYKKLITHFPAISLVRASDKVHTFYEVFSQVLNENIKKCISTLQDVGYFIDPELTIIMGVFGNAEVQGQINMDEKEIRLSVDLEKLSFSDIMYVLVEENEHYRTGFSDLTRNFQTHFLKLYVNQLVKNLEVKA